MPKTNSDWKAIGVALCADDDGKQWVWAGREDDERLGDGTAECRDLASSGLLADHSIVDGYHVWAVKGGDDETVSIPSGATAD